MKSIRNLTIATALLFASNAALAGGDHDHGHGGDIVVGITGTNQLAIEFDFDEAIELPEILSGPLSGWGADEPGFMSLDADEPDEGFFTLGAGADIRFEVIAFDDALVGWTQGFAGTFDDAGEQLVLGSPDFDEHAFWQIDSTDPGFNPLQTEWHATGRLVDAGSTGYLPSDPFTLAFVPVPEPAAATLLVLAGAVVTIRRKRTTA